MTGSSLPDAAYAAALSALPEMTPAQLRRLLGGAPARELYERVAAGDAGLIEPLLAMGHSRRTGRSGRSRRTEDAGDDPGTPGPSRMSESVPLFGAASEIQRRRQSLVGRLTSWRHEIGRHSVEDLWAGLVGRGISVVRRGDPAYPRRLLRSDFPPELLYVKGSLSHATAPTVAIVGTRRATHYGMDIAGEMGRGLAERGVAVVSGLARGIDAAAHVGYLSVPERAVGPVAAVGGGVDVVYPSENRRLWEAVSEAGALLSEAPMGAPPEGWRFPLRNRIIAALSQVVVVVESSRQGGAMHTVQAADSMGIPVLAVPGSVRSPQSEGTNAIIGEGGAGLATDVYDILTALSLVSMEDGTKVTFSPLRPTAAGGSARAGRRSSPPLSASDDELIRRQVLASCTPDERAVYEALEHTPTSFDIVCARTHHDVGTVALALDHLEELGLARSVGPSWQRA